MSWTGGRHHFFNANQICRYPAHRSWHSEYVLKPPSNACLIELPLMPELEGERNWIASIGLLPSRLVATCGGACGGGRDAQKMGQTMLRKTARARLTRSNRASSACPITPPILLAGTTVILSIAICDFSRRPFRGLGATSRRNRSASSRRVVVRGQITTEGR